MIVSEQKFPSGLPGRIFCFWEALKFLSAESTKFVRFE